MRHRHISRLAVLLLATLTAGCSASTSPPATPRAQDTGASWNLESRIGALDAFGGRRPSMEARWTEHTIEGAPIDFALQVGVGHAVLERDARADGGTVERFDLTSLELVRYVPSVWVNDQEVAKEYLVTVDAADARADAGTYYLRGRCASNGCEQIF
jgi:hypothetical protein